LKTRQFEQAFSSEYQRTLFADYDFAMGKHKFKFINCEIRGEFVWKKVEPIFTEICRQNWTAPAAGAVDELIEPENVNDSRTIFMERKPHPFGFLEYILGVRGSLTGLPYAWSIAF
jgi:hypothetical protein